MAEYDFKKEWPKIKKELGRLGQEALSLTKKGEERIITLTQKGKLHVDSTALGLKREHLYHLIGKEYVKGKCACPTTAKMQKYLSDLRRLEKEIKTIGKKIKKVG